MTKQRLVVVGNGMAGARAVEEILARGGGDRFDVVMFGDEPYGNYNRIMLSNVLSGAQAEGEIYLNSLDWYAANGIALHAGERVVEIDRAARKVRSDKGTVAAYDKLLIATGSRAFIPPAKGMTDERRRAHPRRHGLPHPRRLQRHAGGGAARHPGRGDRRRPSRARGRAGHAEPRLRGARRPSRRPADGGAARRSGGGRCCRRRWRASASGSTCEKIDDRGPARRRAARGARLQGRLDARLRPGDRLGRHPPEQRDRHALRADHRARHRGRRPHALGRRSQRLRRRRMRPAPRPGLRPGGAALGAGQGDRRPARRHQPDCCLFRLQARHQAQGDGGGARLDGRDRALRRGGRGGAVLRAPARHLQEAGDPRRAADRRDHARRSRQGRLSHAGVRPQHPPAGRAAVPALRHRGAGQGGLLRGDGRRRPGLQLQRRLQGQDRRLRGAAARAAPRR